MMRNKYLVRPADPSEAEKLTQLAILSKGHWGYPKAWLEAWQSELTVTPEMIKNSIAFVVELNGTIVGFWCRSISESHNPTPGLLFIHPDHMRKGLGQLLFDAVKSEAIKRGIKYFIIEADPNAVKFYLKMGAEKIGEKKSTVIPDRLIPILKFNFRK